MVKITRDRILVPGPTGGTGPQGPIGATGPQGPIGATGPSTAGVASVNTRIGDVVLAKSDVGLGNADDTSDAAKPVSTAQQTALDAKAALAHMHPYATSPSLPGWRTGRYYGVASSIPITGFSAIAMTANRHYGLPFYCPQAVTVDRVGLEVTATAGSIIRIGLYTMGTNGLPGTMVVEFGTVSSATVGAKEITISRSLAADTWYFLVITSDGGPSIRYGTPALNASGGTTPGSVQRHAMPHVDRALSSLASPFGTPTGYNDQYLFLCDVRST